MSARLRRRYRHPPWYNWSEGLPLVAMDLGKRKMGIAVFDADGTLTSAATVRAKITRSWTPWRTCDAIVLALKDMRVETFDAVCEMPRLRGMEINKDIDCLIRVGAVLPEYIGPWSETYAPAEWKSQVAKDLHHRRIREALMESETALWDGQGHDARDAVGIGLFALGRVDNIGRALV